MPSNTTRTPGTLRQLTLAIALALPTLGAPQLVLAAGNQAQQFNIPAQPLADALNAFIATSDWQVGFPAGLAKDVRANPVYGNYTPQQALDRLVTGKGLAVRQTGGSVTLVKTATPVVVATTSAQSAVTLPMMKVTGKAEGDDSTDPYNSGYNRTNAVTATKTDTPIMETPMSVQIVPQQVLKDQQAIRLEDALKNVSGVVTGYGFGSLEDTFIIRGFENSTNSWSLTEVYRDGALVVEGLFSLADVERVEVLKGPAAMLYGRLQPGGLINVVTKRPQAEAGYALEQQFGSFNTYRTTGNATGALTHDGALTYRLDFEYLDKDSFRAFPFNEQTFFSPKLSWRISDNTQLDAEYVYFDQDSFSDWGLPVIGARVADLPFERSLEEPQGRYSNDFQGGGLTLSHNFNDHWSLQGKLFQYAETYSSYDYVSPRALDESTGILTRSMSTGDHVFDSTFGMVNLTGKFSTWALDHTLLMGWDYFDSGFDEFGVRLSAADGVAPINIYHPVYGQGVQTTAGRANNFSYRIGDSWYGFYLQDQIKLGEQWHLLAGFRYDDADSSQSFAADRSDFLEDTDSEFSPRVGLLYHPVKWLSVYGSYVEGYHHSNIGQTVDSSNLLPEQSHQYEAGLKGEWWDGKLTSTLTFYHLTKENIKVPDQDPLLAQQGFVEQAGEARSRGVEFDVSGQLSKDWRMIGSYAFTDARITEDQSFDALGNLTDGNQGNRLRNVPEHAGSFWLQHEFNELGWRGLSGGMGVYFAGEREGDLANSFQMPGYARLDAMLRYSRKVGGSKLSLQFNAQNITDEEYFVAARSRVSVTPAIPVNFLGSVRLEF